MEIKLLDRQKFFDLVNNARLKKHPTNYALMNLVTFSCMFPELKKHLKGSNDLIIVDGVKIQLSLYVKQEIIYLSHKKFDIESAEANFKFNQEFRKF